MYAIKKLDFPLFHKGLTPTDIKGRGRVEAVNVPLNFEGAMVKPGQWLFADTDGIIIFDAEIVFEIANKVSDLIDHERAIVSDIQSGLTGEELAQKYDGF
jgi:regulator of RNase E activity RraA